MDYWWSFPLPLSQPIDCLIEQTQYNAAGNQPQVFQPDIGFQLINELLPGIRLSLARSVTAEQLQYAESPICDMRAKVSIRLQVMSSYYRPVSLPSNLCITDSAIRT